MAAPSRKPKVNPMQSPTPMAKPTKFGNHTPISTKAPGMASGKPAKASDMGDLGKYGLDAHHFYGRR